MEVKILCLPLYYKLLTKFSCRHTAKMSTRADNSRWGTDG